MAINIFNLLANNATDESVDLSLSLLDTRLENLAIDIQQAGQIGELNKQFARINATFARQSAEKDAMQIRRQTDASVGRIIASAAASGIVTSEGSAFLAQTEQEIEGQREIEKILSRGELDAMNSEIEVQRISLEQAFREVKAANIASQDILSTNADINATTGRLNLFT